MSLVDQTIRLCNLPCNRFFVIMSYCSYASACGSAPGVQWKWVGHGWAPVSAPLGEISPMSQMSPGLGCLGCGPGSRYSDHRGHRRAILRNRKVEVVLWVFIIFLLIVIGLLTYSHLQLLTTLNDEGMDPFSETFSR